MKKLLFRITYAGENKQARAFTCYADSEAEAVERWETDVAEPSGECLDFVGCVELDGVTFRPKQ